jgi:hypothetical protein
MTAQIETMVAIKPGESCYGPTRRPRLASAASANACCSATVQETCCVPAAKADCCGQAIITNEAEVGTWVG